MKSEFFKQQRLGATNYNNQGCLMKVIEYNGCNDIVIEFQDKYKERVKTTWQLFKSGLIACPTYYKNNRLGTIKRNKQGDLMKIVEYNGSKDMIIEFEDGMQVKTTWERFNKGCTYNPNNLQKRCTNKYQERVGLVNTNKNGEIMKIIEYINATNVMVEFQDEYKTKVKTYWTLFKDGSTVNPNGQIKKPDEHIARLGTEMVNTQGCLMKVVEYNNADNIVVEFQDEYKWKKQTTWQHFINGQVNNAYCVTIYGAGIVGNKYPIRENGITTKEYNTWTSMIERTHVLHKRFSAYRNVTCCKEWLLYENFYEWIRQQENFEVWKQMPRSALDKDILVKGNKVYGPDTCCLVPDYINLLFTSRRKKNKVQIQQMAQEEYNKGTIDKKCYEAMMKWAVEITD